MAATRRRQSRQDRRRHRRRQRARRPQPRIRTALSAACALAGVGGASAVAAQTTGEGAVLYYGEPQRVKATEAVAEIHHTLPGERALDFKVVFDALTGASASGAVPSDSVQTFARPSGNAGYTVPAGQTPLDDTFHDTRVAVSGNATLPLGRLTRTTLGLYGSTEYDYTSLGASATLARDLDRRNTTLQAGLSYSADTVSPVGGRPIPLTSMVAAPGEGGGDDKLRREDDDGPGSGPRLPGDGSKDVLDAIVGVTQVLGRDTIAQVNYSLSRVSGYQTDPYKVVSVVDPVSGAPRDQLFEKRPDRRTKQILYGQLKHHLPYGIADLSYRYMTDDWGIRSHTVDVSWRLPVAQDSYLMPRVRYYHQTAADFYSRYLVQGAPLPTDVTADYRLGRMHTWTFGLEHGRPVGNGHRMSVRLEYYRQDGDAGASDAPGYLGTVDLFPVVDAWIAQVGYSFGS